jgi:P-type conjugative transfer protein TrbJ
MIMKFESRSFLTKVVLILFVYVVSITTTPIYAGIPVIDGGNLIQNVLQAIESISQTLKQIESYKTQLQQYETMLKNTTSPSTYTWDRAMETMNRLLGSIDTLNYYKTQLGSIDSYLNKFQDLSHYRNSPCFSEAGCSASEWADLLNSQNFGSETQKRAVDALFKGLDTQQDAMVTDARTLQTLQSTAQGATGQVQAIGYANQFASQQTNQLLQIRGLLVAQQNAIATRNQALADREAQQGAAGQQLRRGSFQSSPLRSW